MIYLIILSVILFWPLSKFAEKLFYRKNGSKGKSMAKWVTLIFVVIINYGFYFTYDQYYSPFIRSKKFDSKVWVNDKTSRYKMTKDLIGNDKLINKTRKSVIDKLGNDFEIGPCKNCIGYSTFDPDQTSLLDHEVLVIYFKKNNKVINVKEEYW